MAALFALGGALFWGVGDFLGGFATKRVPVLAVLVLSQAVGLVGVALWVVLGGDPFPGAGELLPGVLAGAAGLVGLAALYRGLAIGAMGIVAPISASYPAVALAVDAVQGITPTTVQWLGVILILGGVIAVSREPRARGARVATGVGLALVASVGFGTFVVGIDAASDESAAWAVATVRATSVAVALAAALVTATALRAPRSLVPLVLAVGAFDTGANVLVALATTRGSAGVVAVLSALYPLVTIVLARLVLGERLSVARRAGGAVALGGAALVAAG